MLRRTACSRLPRPPRRGSRRRRVARSRSSCATPRRRRAAGRHWLDGAQVAKRDLGIEPASARRRPGTWLHGARDPRLERGLRVGHGAFDVPCSAAASSHRFAAAGRPRSRWTQAPTRRDRRVLLEPALVVEPVEPALDRRDPTGGARGQREAGDQRRARRSKSPARGHGRSRPHGAPFASLPLPPLVDGAPGRALARAAPARRGGSSRNSWWYRYHSRRRSSGTTNRFAVAIDSSLLADPAESSSASQSGPHIRSRTAVRVRKLTSLRPQSRQVLEVEIVDDEAVVAADAAIRRPALRSLRPSAIVRRGTRRRPTPRFGRSARPPRRLELHAEAAQQQARPRGGSARARRHRPRRVDRPPAFVRSEAAAGCGPRARVSIPRGTCSASAATRWTLSPGPEQVDVVEYEHERTGAAAAAARGAGALARPTASVVRVPGRPRVDGLGSRRPEATRLARLIGSSSSSSIDTQTNGRPSRSAHCASTVVFP